MSNTENPMDEPRYGRRSDSWTPEPQAPSAADSSSTPWPQYGQLSGQGTSASSAPQPGTPNGGAYGAPSTGQPYSAPTPGAAPGAPFGTPYGAPAGAPYGGGQPGPALPGRGGGIALLIGGLISMLIIAPTVFLLVLLGGMNLGEIARSATPVTSGQTVTINEDGTYTVIANRGDVYGCSLTDSSGVEKQMDYYASTSPTFWVQDLTPGNYVLNCQTEGTVDMVGIGGLTVDTATSATLAALGWSTLVGFIGLALTIWGIVKIVRVNRQRREIQRTYGIY